MKKKNIVLIIVLSILGLFLLTAFTIIPFFLILYSTATSKPIITDNIDKYDQVIGDQSEYSYKWGMNEEIFPKKIKESYDVKEFVNVYYNPWDANYLTFLEIEYNDEDYDKEINRLKEIGIERYKGIYGAEGFDKYELVAMESDSYQGLIYALTDNDNKIIYVEMIFCNYIMDIDYEEYIPKDYLPKGFNAKEDNPYRKENIDQKK